MTAAAPLLAAGLSLAAAQPMASAQQAAPAAGMVPPVEIPSRPEELRLPDTAFEPPLPGRPGIVVSTLANGLRVVVVEDRGVPLVDVTLALRTGLVDDDPEAPGTASLAMSMLRRAGAAELDADAFDDAVAALGARLDSVGGSARSGLTLSCLPSVLPRALELWSAMLLAPRLDEDRLELARANLASSMASRYDDPLAVLGREWDWLVHGGESPLAHPLLPADLERLTAGRLRRWLEGLRPADAVVAVAGAVEAERALELLADRLGDWRPAARDAACGGASGCRERPEEAPWEPFASAPPGLYHLAFDTPQLKVMLGHPGARRTGWEDAEMDAARVMAEVLAGAGAVSRLRGRLRHQEGLVYRLSSAFGIEVGRPGVFEVFFETDAANGLRAIELVREEMQRLQRDRLSDAELELAQKSLTSAFPLRFDGAERVAGQIAEDLLLGRPHEFWSTFVRRIRSVDAEAVRRAARRWLRPDELRAVWIGEPPDPKPASRLFDRVIELPARDPVTLEAVRIER